MSKTKMYEGKLERTWVAVQISQVQDVGRAALGASRCAQQGLALLVVGGDGGGGGGEEKDGGEAHDGCSFGGSLNEEI
jgi:hypothetical protein